MAIWTWFQRAECPRTLAICTPLSKELSYPQTFTFLMLAFKCFTF